MPRFAALFFIFARIVRENNEGLDKTFIYNYNGIGNITSVKTCVSIDGKVYVGWGISFDFSNGIKIGIAVGAGFEISINF